MKVRLTMTVEVDPEAWATEYGIDLKEVRKDVQGYFSSYAQEHINGLGLQPKEKA